MVGTPDGSLSRVEAHELLRGKDNWKYLGENDKLSKKGNVLVSAQPDFCGLPGFFFQLLLLFAQLATLSFLWCSAVLTSRKLGRAHLPY